MMTIITSNASDAWMVVEVGVVIIMTMGIADVSPWGWWWTPQPSWSR